MRRILSGAVAVLVVAGCGGESETLSADAFRERANAICKQLDEENQKAFKGIDTDDQEAMIRATEDLGARTQKALEDLGELEGPEASEAAVDRILSRAKALSEVNAKLASGDAEAAEEATRLTTEAQTAAKDAGLKDCT
ncbi:lipoprotein [Solirubrobacter phytolaccae]|uniref:Lipoprotein n=1 Tax=Solirubrobacter phytolaccae TaxID=1404360 RepID=A0A9X3S5U4_9ACTN|nr:lipoprotein [Solirubrobacter phytolaccae]MDA0179314.1 lipoprotein [Solirubrobacter phytolaccae]